MRCVIPDDLDVSHGAYHLAVCDCTILENSHKNGVFGLLIAAAHDKTGREFVRMLEKKTRFEYLILQARWDMLHGITDDAVLSHIWGNMKNRNVAEYWEKTGRFRLAMDVKYCRSMSDLEDVLKKQEVWTA